LLPLLFEHRALRFKYAHPQKCLFALRAFHCNPWRSATSNTTTANEHVAAGIAVKNPEPCANAGVVAGEDL